MSLLKQMFDFLHDNIDIIKDNPWVFLTFIFICVGLCAAIISWRDKRSQKKIDLLKEQIGLLKEQNDTLNNQLREQKSEYDALKSSLKNADTTKLLMGLRSGERSNSAENVSKHISEKYISEEDK